VSVGKPMLYMLERGEGIVEVGGHISTYGDSPNLANVKLIKP
jgi:hypothetical protein